MLAQPDTITVPVLCPADGCWTLIDCTVVILAPVATDAAGRGAEIGVSVSAETALAEVSLHMLEAHPELCEPAPIEP